jgi:hypothetical protein
MKTAGDGLIPAGVPCYLADLTVRSIAVISAHSSDLPTTMVVAKLSARVGPMSRASIAAVMVPEIRRGFQYWL